LDADSRLDSDKLLVDSVLLDSESADPDTVLLAFAACWPSAAGAFCGAVAVGL